MLSIFIANEITSDLLKVCNDIFDFNTIFLFAALGNLGSVLSSQGRFEEAEEALLGALRHRANMADVHYNL